MHSNQHIHTNKPLPIFTKLQHGSKRGLGDCTRRKRMQNEDRRCQRKVKQKDQTCMRWRQQKGNNKREKETSNWWKYIWISVCCLPEAVRLRNPSGKGTFKTSTTSLCFLFTVLHHSLYYYPTSVLPFTHFIQLAQLEKKDRKKTYELQRNIQMIIKNNHD